MTPATLTVYFQNFAAAKLKGSTEGQVIADAFGILRIRNRCHPVCIEVKWDVDNCWSAIVQNLQQVQFFRYSGKKFQARLGEFVPPSCTLGGVLGIVIAPPDYWCEKKRFSHGKSLLASMQKRFEGFSPTKARVLLLSCDKAGPVIKSVGGYLHRA